MIDGSAFGLRAGTNVWKAATLAARPSGVTMGEIEDATGDTQYNIFRSLEAKGHFVRRQGAGRGMRIWLRHRDEQLLEGDGPIGPEQEDVPQNGADETLDLETAYSDSDRLTFSLERDLQRALRGSLDRLEPGLVAIDGGREDGFRDVTAKDSSGSIVVVELKAGKAGPNAVAQLLSYMGEVKALQSPTGPIRGILIAADFHSKALAAASVVPHIVLKRYAFNLTFEGVPGV